MSKSFTFSIHFTGKIKLVDRHMWMKKNYMKNCSPNKLETSSKKPIVENVTFYEAINTIDGKKIFIAKMSHALRKTQDPIHRTKNRTFKFKRS